MRDSDVRSAVMARLAERYGSDSNTRIVEEMGIWANSARIDIAVINGELSGYELKSDSDTLLRLPRQIELYGRVFDRMTLVVGERHFDSAIERIPGWWGCYVARMRRGVVKLARKRAARANPSRDAFVLAQMLWKTEALAVLERHGKATGWRAKPAAMISRRLVEELNIAVLAAEVRATLRARPALGQLGPRELDMAINGVTDPGLRTARRRRRILSDIGNDGIAPTVGQWLMAGRPHNGLGMVPVLGCAVGAAAAGSHPMQNLKDISAGVLRVDWNGPLNVVDCGVGADGRVVAEVKNVGEGLGVHGLPED